MLTVETHQPMLFVYSNFNTNHHVRALMT